MDANVLYYGDNLTWLRNHDKFPNESVDLIYLDPPFNSNADYNVIFSEPSGEKSEAQLRAFRDYPSIQIRTIKELLIDGRGFDLPPQLNPLKQAPRFRDIGRTHQLL